MRFPRVFAPKIFLFICLLAVTASFSRSGTAWALLSNLFAKNQAPTLAQQYPIQDEESFQAVVKSFHGTPFNEPELEYEILLPKDWTSDDIARADNTYGLSRELIGDLARFKSPYINTMQAIVTIQSIKLDREISAENWLKSYILTSNYALQDKVIAANDKKASAYGVSTSEGTSNYIYVTVQINGNNAVIVRFETPLGLKEPLAFVRKRIVDSFQFILATDRSIEAQKVFDFADSLRFSYPESWVPNHVDVKDTSYMTMQLYNSMSTDVYNNNQLKTRISNAARRVDGYIRFVVVKRNPNTSLKKEAKETRKFFDEILGIDFKKLISSEKAPTTTSRFIFSRYEVYDVVSKKANSVDQEVRLVVLGDKDWYVFAFLLTPSATEDFYAWACNTQAFDMMIKAFR